MYLTFESKFTSGMKLVDLVMPKEQSSMGLQNVEKVDGAQWKWQSAINHYPRLLVVPLITSRIVFSSCQKYAVGLYFDLYCVFIPLYCIIYFIYASVS